MVYLRRLIQQLTEGGEPPRRQLKGKIILDLWVFKDLPSGSPSQKSLVVFFFPTVGFMVCLRLKTILLSFC